MSSSCQRGSGPLFVFLDCGGGGFGLVKALGDKVTDLIGGADGIDGLQQEVRSFQSWQSIVVAVAVVLLLLPFVLIKMWRSRANSVKPGDKRSEVLQIQLQRNNNNHSKQPSHRYCQLNNNHHAFDNTFAKVQRLSLKERGCTANSKRPFMQLKQTFALFLLVFLRKRKCVPQPACASGLWCSGAGWCCF
eukprot:scaffold437_cov168-Ochromonas_danica.AAC.29